MKPQFIFILHIGKYVKMTLFYPILSITSSKNFKLSTKHFDKIFYQYSWIFSQMKRVKWSDRALTIIWFLIKWLTMLWIAYSNTRKFIIFSFFAKNQVNFLSCSTRWRNIKHWNNAGVLNLKNWRFQKFWQHNYFLFDIPPFWLIHVIGMITF